MRSATDSDLSSVTPLGVTGSGLRAWFASLVRSGLMRGKAHSDSSGWGGAYLCPRYSNVRSKFTTRP